MLPITSHQRLMCDMSIPNENKKLCKEIICVMISTTTCCTIFMLWFLYEINSEFHNSTTYMDPNR